MLFRDHEQIQAALEGVEHRLLLYVYSVHTEYCASQD